MDKIRVLITGSDGYIGSELTYHLAQDDRFRVSGIDCSLHSSNIVFDRANVHSTHFTEFDTFLDNEIIITNYDWIVHLAGHSSVGMCKTDVPYMDSGAYHNNVVSFHKLLCKLPEKSHKAPKVIYASSASVYGEKGTSCVEDWAKPENFKTDMKSEPYYCANYYDASKWHMDCFAHYASAYSIGLRFATVNGPSVNFRSELLLNSMVTSAITDGVIKISQPHLQRSILDISHLCHVVTEIMTHSPGIPKGVYNLATTHSSVIALANEVQNTFSNEYGKNVKIDHSLSTTSPYNFTLDSSKLKYNLGLSKLYPPAFTISNPRTLIKTLYEAITTQKMPDGSGRRIHFTNRNDPVGRIRRIIK